MRDIAIIGKGPAGYSCAITAKMRGLDTLIITPKVNVSWLARTDRVDNYPGLPEVSGADLLKAFEDQATAMGAETMHGMVRQILPTGEGFMLLVENDVVEAKTVVFATGAAKPKLLPGEEELIGAGVSYCATCDGHFYKGKSIAVLSENDQGAEEAKFLHGIVGKMDYYPLRKHEVPEAFQTIAERPVSLARGDAGIAVETKDKQRTYDGVFIFRMGMPLNMLLDGLDAPDTGITVDRHMRTNIPGVFAAGDCTGKPHQVAKAVGEGNIAAITAAEYIQQG
ncbi:MAG TPA: FAD-dependent oxidoreductase [Candidatus Limiplasma sp.]|nr:FAD-dependent oxidoreductase [Candidatus Limiplasma sp.]HRX08629.1 FAD-dependent oxidoreductase [Candidatus Limiplasma sp.]